MLAMAAWGSEWSNRQVVCHCDNQVVVACLKSRTSKCKGLMHLLRCLLFIEAQQRCYLHPLYIDTHSNYLADALSRNNLPLFLSKLPGADHHPTTTSLPLLDLLLDPSADWTSPRWRHYFRNGLAPSTQKTYQAANKRFLSFCTQYNVSQPFPLSEHLLCSFAAYLADQGLAPQTGKSYLSALRSMQISLGLPDPRDQSSLPILKRVQAGISRTRALKGTPTRIRLPITVRILEAIQHSLATSTNPDKGVLWAVSASAFFGFFRLGELLQESSTQFNPATSLAWGDVAVDSHANPKMIQFHLKVSKCDQFGAGLILLWAVQTPLSAQWQLFSSVSRFGVTPRVHFSSILHTKL